MKTNLFRFAMNEFDLSDKFNVNTPDLHGIMKNIKAQTIIFR